MPILKIISGGQTGADRGGLDAAIHCDVPHGGWCPKGRKAEDGRIPDQYQLQEMPTSNYESRTEANVVDSDATVVFTHGFATGGSLLTLKCTERHAKPWLHTDLATMTRKGAVQRIVQWINGELDDPEAPKPARNLILNVAGSRESKDPGIAEKVMAIVVDVLIAVNPECKSFYPLPTSII